MSGTPFVPPRFIPVSSTGRPYPAAKLYFYRAGTTTLATVYTDSALSVPSSNPLTANSAGMFPAVYLNPASGFDYKAVLQTSAGVQLWSEDNIPANRVTRAEVGQVLYPIVDGETTVSDYSYPPGNVKRYGAVGDGSTDDTVAIQRALDYAHAGAGEAFIPAGTYVTGNLNWPGNNITLRGAGSAYSYNSSATPKTTLVARAGTTIVIDLVQTGLAEDRTGNYIADIEVDGASEALVGIDVAGANIIERVRVTGCTTAGIRLGNFTNSTRLVRCGLCLNSGYGLVTEGVSSTVYSVDDCVLSLNTLGGADIETGVGVRFSNCVFESNTGPGLRIYKPNTHTNAFQGFIFDNCWFEDNASASPYFNVVISSATSDPAYGVSRVTFRGCRFNSSQATRKHISLTVGKWIAFEGCSFDASTQTDAITLATNAHYISFIESSTMAFTGLSAAQLDNAIAQGQYCWHYSKDVKRVVGAGSPAAAFANSWVAYGDPHATPKYWFDRDGSVCLEGAIKSGTVTSAAFTLPTGYRPSKQMNFTVDSNGAFGQLVIAADGTVVPQVGSNTIFNLNGVRFAP